MSKVDSVLAIQARVAASHGLTVELLIGPRQTRRIVSAGKEAIGLVRIELGLSTVQIGRAFHRHHTTILYALGRVKKAPRIALGGRSRSKVNPPMGGPHPHHGLTWGIGGLFPVAPNAPG